MSRITDSGVDAVADGVVARGVASTTYAWCAAHPRCYKAAITCSARTQLAAHQEDVYCFPAYTAQRSTCHCGIRVDQSDVFLNDFLPSVPLWLAVWQARLLYRLFGRAVEVSVVDLDTLSLEALLTAWEGTEVKVRSIVSKRRFTACVAQHYRLTGRLFTALEELQELQLLPSPYEDASLAVVQHIPSLQRIFANLCCLEYLKPLQNLYQLQELHIAQSQIRDRELHILAQLPLLSTLGISGCSQLSSLNALAGAPSLRVLRAANCERLVRIAQLSSVATLRFLDLAGNVFLPSEFAAFLTLQPLALQTGHFMHLRWPREDPADVQKLLSCLTHLHASHCTLPNIRWLCGARNLEQLFLNHTNVTDSDMEELAPHTPFLRALSLSYCDHLRTNLDFVHAMPQLAILTISRSSLPAPFPELELIRRSMTVTLS